MTTAPEQVTAAHNQAETHRYTVHYPDHAPRTGDPHYADFEAYRRRTHSTAVCARAASGGCVGGLELHHAHVEFALANGVDLALLEADYPGIGTPDQVGEWIETAANLEWLCVFHHRGHGGAHVASASDFEAERYVRGLIS